MATWNTATFEATPAAANSPSLFPTEMHNTRTEIRSRADQEHNFNSTPSEGNCYHKEGSAVAYYVAAAPTLRPDGVTALGTADTGRIFVDSDLAFNPKCFDGSDFNATDYSANNCLIHCQPIVYNSGHCPLLFLSTNTILGFQLVLNGSDTSTTNLFFFPGPATPGKTLNPLWHTIYFDKVDYYTSSGVDYGTYLVEGTNVWRINYTSVFGTVSSGYITIWYKEA